MTVTVATSQVLDRQRVGRHMETTTRLAMSSTYVTGGVPITPGTLGLSRIDAVVSIQPVGTSVAPLGGQWDSANSKIMLYETAGTVDLPFKELSSGATVANSFDVTARGLG